MSSQDLLIWMKCVCILLGLQTTFFSSCQGACTPDTVQNAEITPNQTSFNEGESIQYECSLGYNLTSGDLNRECETGDTWTGDPPVCTVSPSESNYNYSTVITYTCLTGYSKTSGNESRTCLENGTWSGETPTCTTVVCTAPPVPMHVSVSPIEGTYNYSTTIIYTCFTGYNKTSGNDSSTCLENGTWSGETPICTIVVCTAPPVPMHASVYPSASSYNYSTVITYMCFTGYSKTSGNESRTCLENGAWSGETPTCTIVTCIAPMMPPFASVDLQAASYNYSTLIKYNCDVGYEVTSGNSSRTCLEDGSWSGDQPNCTIISCSTEPAQHASFLPNTSSVTYLTEVEYFCEFAFNVTNGDMLRECQANKSLSGTLPTCSIVTCEADHVQNATITSSFSVYNYSNEVTYECDIGYYHSTGNITRICTEDGSWTGALPVCQIVECSPPSDINHATYTPVQATYIWQTQVEYGCDIQYHHVTGTNKTTCNELGNFPAVSLDCSVPHNLTINPLAPSVLWLNSSVTSDNFDFDFDGVCDVTLSSNPATLTLTRAIYGNSLSVTVSQNGQTTDGSYVVSVEPFHDGNTWTTVTFDVFYGNYINGFQAVLENGDTTIAALKDYNYTVSVKPDTSADVDLIAIFEPPSNITTYIPGTFTSYVFTYAFQNTGTYNISFSAMNPVSPVSYSFLEVFVIAPINSLEIVLDSDLIETNVLTDINVQFNSTTLLPMDDISITISYGDGTEKMINDSLYETASLPHSLPSKIVYDVQGEYNITVSASNIISSLVLHKTMRVWDNITNVNLVIINTTDYFITGETLAVEFQNVTRSGFEYLIDFTDGDTFTNPSSNILYQNYSHEVFFNSYATAGIYYIQWNISNGAYNIQGTTRAIIENTIKDLMAWLQNSIISIAVGTVYSYEANATEGSNATVNWNMDDGTNINNMISGELTSDVITHTYTGPAEYNISITASNLVSSEKVYVGVDAFYKPNGIVFSASKTATNITFEVEFYFIVQTSALLPMKDVNYTINYKHGPDNVTGSLVMGSNYTLPSTITYKYTFTTQGDYYVDAKIENILGYLNYTLLIRVWDGLDDLDFDFVGDNGVYITNETARFEFINPPNGGHIYYIDYGDGTIVEYADEEIYFRPFNLTIFEHAYGYPGVYTLQWKAANKPYNRTESKIILVQNPIPSHSFTLEPDNKKYPWINLQSMSISLNITLNDTVALPTNATCVFYPGDGTPDITDLTFSGAFFEYEHQYLTEGNFTSRFNCSNLVSYYIYEYNVTVQKFQATFITIDYAEVVPLNRSDSVEVFFHVINQNFALIPYNVEIEFDFGDGTSRRRKRAVEVYDKPTYTHTYTERGNYTVTVNVDATVTNTQNTLNYSIRIGTMYFEYSDVIAFINYTLVEYTMHGVLGSSTVYTLDYDDGTTYGSCNSMDYNGCSTDHYCPFYGYKNVTVTASNGTFIEIDWVNITCDNPITVALDVPWTVSIPTGYVELKLHINETALYLPVLNIKVHMGDPINRTTYNFTAEVTYENPFVFPFSYIALGRQTITVFCWNLINETDFLTKITVTNENFLFTGTFDRKYSQPSSPMYMTSMRDTEIFSRLFINANRTLRTHTNHWIIGADVDQSLIRHGLIFTVGLVEETKYLVKLNTSFIEEPENIIQEPTYLEFVIPPPHVEIVGGTRRVEQLGSSIVDAVSLSYDPTYPGSGPLTFTWICVGYTASGFDDAENKHISSTSGSTCQYDENNGSLVLNTYLTTSNTHYVVLVTAENNRSVQASFKQILEISSNSNPLSIRCKVNCLAKVGVSSYLQLVPDVPHNCPASFTWMIYTKTGAAVNTSVNILSDLITANLTETEATSRTLTIKPNAFAYNSSYLVSLRMVYNGLTYGPAYHEFKTNQIPRGGTCDIIPYDEQLRELPFLNSSVTHEAIATKDIFNLTCLDWMDEGFTDSTFTNNQPLLYYFFTRYTNDPHARQILYFDPGATSNLVTFQVGDPDNNYLLEVVLRIVDIFGDYEELIYKVKSAPNSTITSEALNVISDTAQVDVVKPYLEEFTDELIKANRTWDYRTLSRKITGIASLYNNIVLNGTTSKVITPEELVNLGGDGELGWTEYWKIIVEVDQSPLASHLIKVGEEYVSYLYESIVTWPSERRFTLSAIQTLSRAVGATLLKKDYANVTAAIMASKIADILALHLANNVEDRTFPITWTVLSAIQGIKALCRNILAELQAVLTPNLPEDPTTDRMRQFLEYINVFKTPDENDQALSLQEQTFLAQKQLQRYYLDKYIKSKASKEALPYLTFALRNLTYVLSKLTDIGQPAYVIENDYFFLSAEIVPANLLQGTTVSRPKVEVGVTSLTSFNAGHCEAVAIPVQTTVFKENPYFWGQFGDRITSYVPVFTFGDAKLGGSTVVYTLENKVTPECTDEIPTYDEGDTNKMIYILFNRQFAEDDLLIFIRPNTTKLIYTVYLNSGEKPDLIENKYEYTTVMRKDANYTLEDGHKLLIKASSYASTGKIWIGLKPVLENSDDESLLLKSFCANVTSVSCLSWVEDASGEYNWDKDMCQVSTASTKVATICECKNTNMTMTVGTTFLVPPNKIDFNRDLVIAGPIGRSPVVGLITSVILSYLILLAWAWREDAKDVYKWSYSLLVDNDIADQYFYILRVFTGMRSCSGTKSNIAFIMAGETSDTGIRMMDDQSHIGFETGSVRTFVLSTRRKLGDLMSIRIWHDDSGGNDSSWFLNKITVCDLENFNRYSFVCEDWLDFDRGDKKVDRVLAAEKSSAVWSFKDMTSYTLAEHHIWVSVFLRPFRSDFTRIQRLSCLYGQIFLTMVLTTFFMKSSTKEEIDNSINIVFLWFSVENFEASIAAVTLTTILIAIVCFFFRFARNKRRNAINSRIRQFYRKVNDRIQLDKSVLKSTYDPPSERAVHHNFNFLPKMVSSIGWACLFVIVLFTTIVMFLMSDGWQLVLSEEWMTTVLCGFLVSFLLIESLKVALIVLLYSLMCQRAYEPTEPFIDIENLKEIAKYNSASLTINPEFSNDLRPPISPDEETLIANKSQRVQNHQLLKMFTQLSLYSGILYLVYTISYESRDMRSYYLKSNIEEMFQFKQEVTDLQSYTEWLNGRFIESYFSNTFFGLAINDTDTALRLFANDLVNYRVGPARLRQLRARPERCQGPLGEGRLCYNRYLESRSAKLDYCIGWKPSPCALSEKSNFFSSPAWEYVSASEVWGFVTVAEYTSYAGGGYFMKLDVNKDVCQKIFDELHEHNWFDRATRAVILEFTMYNANTNLFVYSKFVAEFTEIGGVITFIDIQVFRLFTDIGTDGDYLKFLQFGFLILVIVASIKILYDICTEGCKYFKSAWNLLDMLALIMSIVTISIYIYKITIINRTTSLFLDDKNAYVGFENLSFYDFVVNTTHGILVFLLSIRVSRILGYSGKINEMAAVISNASSDLGAFLVIFGITYLAYVIMGTLLFGAENEKYKDLFNTYGTITEAIVGKNRLEKILVEKPGFAEFYYFTFVLYVLFTLTTMAAAILNFSISYVKEEQKKLAPTNIVEIIADRIMRALNFIKGKKNTNESDSNGNADNRRDSSDEISMNDILIDFHVFIRNLDTIEKVQSDGGKASTTVNILRNERTENVTSC